MSSTGWTIEEGQLFRDGLPADLDLVRKYAADLRSSELQLVMSRLMLSPVLVARGDFPGEMSVSLCVRLSDQWHGLSLGQDHLVAGRRVHAVDQELQSRLGELAAMHVCDISSMTGPEYVSLLAEPLLQGLIVDEVSRVAAVEAVGPVSPAIVEASGLQASLYPYQAEGVAAMLVLSQSEVGALLGDEMGLGKTLQVIALLSLELDKGQSLVICPGSLIENWRRELSQFAPHLSVAVHHGPGRGTLPDRFPASDVVVSTYETVTNDVAFLEERQFNLVVLDEAQMVKNPDASRSTAIKRLQRRIGVAVTGTPLENSLVDLWSLAEFVHPGLLGRRENFLTSFPDESAAAERLGQIMGPVTIRRSVDQVALELPPLIETMRPMRMDLALQNRYDEVLASGDGLEINTQLRVVAAHADEAEDSFEGSQKNEFVLLQLDRILRMPEKALIFCDFRRTLDRLFSLLRQEFPSTYVQIIDGKTERSERQSIVDTFSSGSRGAVLLLNPRAAGVGLNITAANHVFHYSPNYNPAVTEQATKRAHRQKQRRPVFVHHLYYVDSVEERAAEIANSKAALADALDEGLRND